MKAYGTKISLSKNSRGVYCIDTVMGCASGMSARAGGCYGDCYAARTAKRYGHDFSVNVLRDFEDHNHVAEVVRQINSARSPFVRIGCSGDPSEDWPHTLSVLRKIQWCNKEIVIITRHWNILTDDQLRWLSELNLCINTSISALDDQATLDSCLWQYRRIETWCKSVLRIISCDFNLGHPEGRRMAEVQDRLFNEPSVIDTVFRPSKNNPLVASGIINVTQEKFNGKRTIASKRNPRTYMGKCACCPDQCGVSVYSPHSYGNRRGVLIQETML